MQQGEEERVMKNITLAHAELQQFQVALYVNVKVSEVKIIS